MFDHGQACFYSHLIYLWSSCTVQNKLLRCSIAFYFMFFHNLDFFICVGLSTSRISVSGFVVCYDLQGFIPSGMQQWDMPANFIKEVNKYIKCLLNLPPPLWENNHRSFILKTYHIEHWNCVCEIIKILVCNNDLTPFNASEPYHAGYLHFCSFWKVVYSPQFW
jgi:hypothetical protein